MAKNKTDGGFQYLKPCASDKLPALIFPLGGIGTGTVGLDANGRLRDWEIFSRPDKGNNPHHSLSCIWIKKGSEKPISKILESQLLPPFEGPTGLGRSSLPGLPRFEKASFTGTYPLAEINFFDKNIPAAVKLEAFNPMIPLDMDSSSLPLVILRYTVENKTDSSIKCGLAYSLTNFMNLQKCEYNKEFKTQKLSAVQLTHIDKTSGHNINGTICICTDAEQGSAVANWDNSEDRNEAMAFWDYFSAKGKLPKSSAKYKASTASVGGFLTLKPGEIKSVNFYISWHFPRRTLGFCGWAGWGTPTTEKKYSKTNIGNYYTKNYKDAWDVIKKNHSKLPILEQQTKQFTNALKTSTLPSEVLDAVLANISTIRTQTLFRAGNGNFHGFEGCTEKSGCCWGDCNHVYNYQTAIGSLYPQISKSLLKTVFLRNTNNRGATAFRTTLPESRKPIIKVAADGTMGSICRLYRQWKITGDNQLLNDCFPAVKNIFDFTWSKGSWDADQDGVMEGVQHNTYDCEFYGPNPLCTLWYLAALKCTAIMAEASGDKTFADKCLSIFKKGSDIVDNELYNGQYYFQKVRPLPESQIKPVFETRTASKNRKKPYNQIENGCLIDQLVGQYYAHICGIGYLLNKKNIHTTLKSIYQNNYRKTLKNHHSTQRIYALNDESGTIICSYPNADRPEIPMPYINELMTGFEYQLAAHAFAEGMISTGIKIARSVRERYDGIRRNPYNEAECGNHYIRAMTSWSMLDFLSGFQYSAVSKKIGFDPQINKDNFQSFFVVPTGWGIYRQKPQSIHIQILYGSLDINTLDLPGNLKSKPVKAVYYNGSKFNNYTRVNSESISTQLEMKVNDELKITFVNKG